MIDKDILERIKHKKHLLYIGKVLDILTIIFIGLKITGQVDMPIWFMFSPLIVALVGGFGYGFYIKYTDFKLVVSKKELIIRALNEYKKIPNEENDFYEVNQLIEDMEAL